MAEVKNILEPVEHLIEGCIKGNRLYQTKLYNTFMQKMFVVCLKYCNNREEAEEVLQEGFTKVFEFLHQFAFEVLLKDG
jgi:RNA polymerase sigma-70 factor (ECF subfamily)